MPLQFEVGADVTKLDRAMNKAKEIVTRRSADMLTAVEGASSGIDRALLGAFGGQAGYSALARYAPAIAGVTAALGALAATAILAGNQLERLQDIAEGSKSAGVSGTFFQTWQNELEKSGISAEEASKALTRAREAVKLQSTDTGQIADNKVFDILNEQAVNSGRLQGVYQQFKEASDVETRIRAVVQAIRELNAAAKETGDTRLDLLGDRIAQLTFGSDKFADAIRKAKDNFSALEEAGLKNGTIFSDEIVARAQNLNERLDAATRTLRDEMHPVMESLARLGLSFQDAWIGIVEATAKVVQGVNAIGNGIAPLIQFLDRIGKTGGLAGAAIRLVADPPAGSAQLPALNVTAQAPLPGPPAGVPLPAPRPSNFDLRKSVDTIKPSSSTGSTFDQVENYLSQLEKTVDVLKAQVSVLGLGNAERTKAIDLARAEAAARERGVALTDTERAKVLQLAEAEAQARKALEDYAKAQRAVADSTNFFGNQMIDVFDQMIFQGAKAEDVMRSLAQTIVKAALQATLLGQGPLAGIFGTTGQNGQPGGLLGSIVSSFGFGGARASGGPVQAGKSYLVGENGPEMVRFGRNGTVVPNAVMGGGAKGAGMNINIQNHGAQIETQQSNGPNGPQLDIIVTAAIMRDMDQRGPISRQLEKRGLRRI